MNGPHPQSGEGLAVDICACFLYGVSQIRERLIEDRIRIDCWGSFFVDADRLRISEKTSKNGVHALGPFSRKAQVLIGFGVQFAFVPAPGHFAVYRNLPQWLLQVV
jgi:hypothetical protein